MPSVKILGDREVHVKSGTSVSLRCLISNVLEEPSYVFWYKEDKRLLSADDGNITITTKRIIGDGAAVSTLTIVHPDPTHSGIYSCRPANLERAFVSLHVIQGRFLIKEGFFADSISQADIDGNLDITKSNKKEG